MKLYNTILLNNKLDRLIENFGLNIKFKSEMLYIIFHIRTYPFKDRNYNSGDFIPIKIEYMRKIISHDYVKLLLDAMILEKILVCDNSYIVGEKSKGYKLSESYNNQKFYLEEIKDTKLSLKIQRRLTDATNEVLNRNDGYSYVTKCMDNLEMDYEKVNTYLNSEKIPKNIRDKIQMMVDVFNIKFCTVDTTGNRLHNNLTNLATPLRNTLTYKGKKLVQCDLKNSQPLLLRALLDEFYVPQEELDKYLNVVCNIGFYEFFADKLNVILNLDNRVEFKKKIFGGVLFDKNRRNLSKYEKVFKEEFPIIFYCMRSMKEEDYKKIPISLQKLESKFIFNCVDILRKENKGIELLTIHDSISCIEGKQGIVYNVMIEEFYRMFKIIPKIKIEKF